MSHEVEALLESRVEACREKDTDRLMSLYSPDIVYFDVVPPLQFTGTDAVRRNFVRHGLVERTLTMPVRADREPVRESRQPFTWATASMQ